MKKILMFCVIAFVVACSNDNVLDSNNLDSKFESKVSSANNYLEDVSVKNLVSFDFDKIGSEHNLGLEYIYSEIYSSKETFKDYDVIQKDSFIRSNVEYFMGESYYRGNLSSLQLNSILKHLSIDQELIDKKDAESLGLHNSKAIEQYDKIFYLLDQYAAHEDLPVNYYENEARKLENVLENYLNDDLITKEEYFSLRSMIVVSIYSLNYWTVNIDRWSNIYPTTNLAKGNDWWHLKRAGISMAKADLLGAGVGLVWGAIYGSVGGPAGALIGGASTAVGMGLNGSAMAGIKYLIQNS